MKGEEDDGHNEDMYEWVWKGQQQHLLEPGTDNDDEDGDEDINKIGWMKIGWEGQYKSNN